MRSPLLMTLLIFNTSPSKTQYLRFFTSELHSTVQFPRLKAQFCFLGLSLFARSVCWIKALALISATTPSNSRTRCFFNQKALWFSDFHFRGLYVLTKIELRFLWFLFLKKTCADVQTKVEGPQFPFALIFQTTHTESSKTRVRSAFQSISFQIYRIFVLFPCRRRTLTRSCGLRASCCWFLRCRWWSANSFRVVWGWDPWFSVHMSLCLITCPRCP